MRKILTAVLFFTMLGGAAYATGLTDPIVEPEVIAADAVQSSDPSVMIFAALALLLIILGTAGAF